MRSREYRVVDVFTSEQLKGNPVGVVLDAVGLTGADMQQIACWTNLSETTFVLPPTQPEADYRLRIFTPRNELPFAGHPILGSAHAAIDACWIKPTGARIVQECGVGLVELTISDNEQGKAISFELQPAEVTKLKRNDVDEMEAILGEDIVRKVSPAIVNVGAVWAVAQLPSVEALLRVKPDFGRSAAFEQRLGINGLSVFANYDEGDTAIEVRSFAPSCGINEDPVCGSGNGSVAKFLHKRKLIPKKGGAYIAGQGQCVGRDGRIAVEVGKDGGIQLGGECVTCVDGTLFC